MIILILKVIVIFIIINILEILFLFLFGVRRNIIASFLLNNILGILFLFMIYYFKIYFTSLSIIDIIVVSSTGIFGVIGLLVKIIW